MAWIFSLRCQKQHTLTALRQSERPSIHHAIRPAITALAQGHGEVAHCLATLELEHEGHVLQQKPSRLGLVNSAENLRNESGTQTADSCRTSLAQVLARKTSGNEIHLRERRDSTNVACQRNIWKTRAKNHLCGGLYLAEKLARVTSEVKTSLHAPDPCEEASYPQAVARPIASWFKRGR